MGVNAVSSLLEDNDSIIAVKDGRAYNNHGGGGAGSPKKIAASKPNKQAT